MKQLSLFTRQLSYRTTSNSYPYPTLLSCISHQLLRSSCAIQWQSIMTDRVVLQRLESYQSGGSAGGIDDSLNQPTSSSSCKRSLFAQFSLIGNSDDEEDTSIENFTNQKRRKFHWYWCMMHYQRLSLAIVLFLCIIAILMRVSTKNKQYTDIREPMSCPIQSSYSVSSDIMDLKNSSTGEIYTCIAFYSISYTCYFNHL